MMLSFKPVGIYLPVDVNNVAFLQWELPEGRKRDSKERLSFWYTYNFTFREEITALLYQFLL